MVFARHSIVAALALALAAPASAQYFGRTPVQWERLEFEVLKTERFDVYYYPEGREAAEQVGRLAERWHARLSQALQFELPGRQPIVLYASHPHFQQTKTIGGAPGEGTGGVTEAFKRRIVLPVGASLAETDHVLGHELVHAFQYAMTGQGRISATNFPAALRMPLWFIEGMAEYLSVGSVDAHTAMWMRDAARREKLPTIRDLSGGRYFPYRYGQALWAYVAGRFGEEKVGAMLRQVGPRSTDVETLIQEVLGVDHETLSKDWHAALRDAATPWLSVRKDPSAYGPALITEKGDGGRINVGPALSPDGERVAFLSERDLFSVELFLADAQTGEIERRLSKTVVDPHLESLQFIASSGAFDRSGKRFALGAVAKGRPLLVLIDTASGDTLQELPLPSLGEIATPSFSPDGGKVVFSALASGFSDLFVYDLAEGVLTRLTNDAYADLQPAWSPDGASIAFVTDRFSTAIGSLDPGNYRLAAVDVVTRAIAPLPSFPRAKNINPQWAPSGASLYFLSDASGTTNVYRLELAEQRLYQVTDLAVGASGITALSPALSAAGSSDRLAYSVYDEGRYEIHSIAETGRLAGWPVELEDDPRAGLIPGGVAPAETLLVERDPGADLPSGAGFVTEPYKAKLGLDYVGQPTVAAGVDRFGAAFAGGFSLGFSDMLGEHTLETTLQATSVSGFNDVGGVVSYVNRVRRFNWGLQVSQVPYVTGAFGRGLQGSGRDAVFVEQSLTERLLDRSVSALGYYPFDQSFRIELQAGFRNIGFDRKLRSDFFDPASGRFLGSSEERLPSADSLDLFEGSLAFVRDTSVFGATSPVLGQRFRFEVVPVRGTVDYTGALADFRQYLMPVRPLTLAARLLHYGRYGGGGQDVRLSPLFLGYQSLVRGYDTGSFSAAECGTGTDCPVFDQLLGSRILVANFEARVPLLALFGAENLYGPIPIEVGAFFDAGVAWDEGTSPSLFGGERDLVKSVGATARLNLLGFAVLQVDYAKPLDRPGKGAFFQFNLLTGF